MAENIKVSVVCPVYNQEELVLKAIDSIPKREDIEIIVIDDCSTDKTHYNILQHYKDDNRLWLFKNIENRGVGYTVNRGIDNASGEYIVLLGSDDYFYTEEFENIMDELDGTDLVYFDMKVNNGDIWEVTPEAKERLCGSVKFMRREFIGNTRCPILKAVEDYIFYQELLQKNPTEKFTHKVVKHYNFPREGSLINLLEKGELVNE